MGDVRVGDALASVDGAASEVIGVFPRGDREVLQVVFSDGAIVECCEDHLWSINHRDWTKPRTLSTLEIEALLRRNSNHLRLQVPLISGDFGVERSLPLDPYLLGLLLGDGAFTSTRCVHYSAGDEEVRQRFEEALPVDCVAHHISRFDWRIVNRDRGEHKPSSVRTAIDDMGLGDKQSHEKFIPAAYLTAPKAVRTFLLKGLLDSDGYTQKPNQLCFCTTSQRLADDAVDLIRGLGGIVGVQAKAPSHTYKGERRQGKPAHVIHIHRPFGRDLATLGRHQRNMFAPTKSVSRRTITAIVRTGTHAPMQCIKVSHPSETYVTDGYVVTHNTTMAHHLAARLGLPLVCVRSEGLIDKYLGSTGQNIGKMMDAAQKHAGEIVLFIDEIDALGGKRQQDSGASQERANSLNVLLRRIELLDAPVLAATNRHDHLDSALWRRFNLQISVDLPGAEERFAILKRYIAPFDPSDEALDLLTSVTDGCSPALLRALMEGFKRAAVLYPRLKRDVNDTPAILEQIVSSVSPPPELNPKPTLWEIKPHERRAIAEKLAWPWGRTS